MPVVISDIDTLQEYMQNLFKNVEHHAIEVRDVVLTVAGLILLFKDRDKEITVHRGRGKQVMASVLWVWINGERYAFSFCHERRRMIIRERSLRGSELASFGAKTSPNSIVEFFKELAE